MGKISKTQTSNRNSKLSKGAGRNDGPTFDKMGKQHTNKKDNKLKKVGHETPIIGKMGKPQTSRKNKKLKKIGERNVGGSKKKIKLKNLDPKNVDVQEIPRKVQFLMDNKDKFKNMDKKKRKKNKKTQNTEDMVPGMTRPIKPAPTFTQGKKESKAKFMQRVDTETKRVLLKSKLSEHYEVDFDDLEHGKMPQKNKRHEKNKQRMKEKRNNMKQKILNKKEDRQGDFNRLQDKVHFGEVVMAPPTLTVKPRKATESNTSKPGQKSLLLKDIIKNNKEHLESGKSVVKRDVGKTLKRKQMSMSQQVIMDRERSNAIIRYREMKNRNLKLNIMPT